MRHLTRPFWLVAGLFAVGLGILGIALPVLPTVPFFLLAAFCFARSHPAWEQRLLDGAYLWLALDGDDVVGVASAGPRHDDDDVDVLLELQMLYLLDRVKGTGLAQVLLTTTLGDVDAYLWVLAGNERAIAFYRKQGFEPDGATKSVAGMPGEVRELRMVRTSWAG